MNEKFIFNGDWKYEVNLSEFSSLFTYNGYQEEPQIRKRIKLKIYDERNYNPDPSVYQLNAIDFIFSNQKEIILSIYDHIINIIFPLHKTYVDDEEIFFPKISSIEDLSNVLGLDEIHIHTEYKDDFSYTSYVFNNFSADTEHGQIIILHKTRFIYTGEDSEPRSIYKDLGLDYNKISEQNSVAYEKRLKEPLIYHSPIEKYNKLKPWQESDNTMFPFQLIHKNQTE